MLKKNKIVPISIITLVIVSSLSYYFIQKKDPQYYTPVVHATHDSGEQFVGSETCKECHKEIFESHLETAHFNTSALANSESIKGSFESGSNTVNLAKLDLNFTKEVGFYYQHSRVPSGMKKSEQFNIVIGSGVKGQSYFTWEKDALYQLQASYYTPTDSWINSPGYPPQYLKRPIMESCLKCHMTFAKNKDFSGQGNQFEKKQMMYGVDCERCHRPSSKHVVHHRKYPKDKIAKFMLSLGSLPQQNQLDVCAQCHSGMRENLLQGNSFSFLAGENLDEYAQNHETGLTSNKELDVHGNQYGLLTSSECFKNSGESFNCTTCHNPHKNQRENTVHFNQKCLSCHSDAITQKKCSVAKGDSNIMNNNCISCHMPTKPSSVMTVQLAKDSLETSVYVRTHLIGVYPKDEWSNK